MYNEKSRLMTVANNSLHCTKIILAVKFNKQKENLYFSSITEKAKFSSWNIYAKHFLEKVRLMKRYLTYKIIFLSLMIPLMRNYKTELCFFTFSTNADNSKIARQNISRWRHGKSRHKGNFWIFESNA